MSKEARSLLDVSDKKNVENRCTAAIAIAMAVALQHVCRGRAGGRLDVGPGPCTPSPILLSNVLSLE